MSGIKVNDSWVQPTGIYVKVDEQWKILSNTYARVDGVWKQTTFGAAPAKPTVSYVSTGLFSIQNYDSSLVYTTTLISGSGSATLNTSTGRYTLSNSPARFKVECSYAVGGPTSAGYMERKPYAYSCRTVSGTCCSTCCVEQCSCGCVGAGPSGCPSGSSPNGQCGCGGAGRECMTGCIGCKTTGQCCSPCSSTVCDVLIDETVNGYINSGTEWYKII